MNTLEFAKILEASGIPRKQAEGHIKVLSAAITDSLNLTIGDRMVTNEIFNKSILRLDKRCDELDKKIDKRCDQLDKKIDKRCNQLEHRFNLLEQEMNYRFDTIETRIVIKLSIVMIALFGLSLTIVGYMLESYFG